ncbi:MAG: transposase [Alkalilacustris sp.]
MRGADGAGKPEAAGERAGRRHQRSARHGSADGGDPPRADRAADGGDRTAGGKPEAASRPDAQRRRLCTISGIGPGIGPLTAGTGAALAPDLDAFDSGRSFAASCRRHAPGLVPRHRSTGGKTRLGPVSKMGQTDIRRLLIVGASRQRRKSRAARSGQRRVPETGHPHRTAAGAAANGRHIKPMAPEGAA